MKNKLKTLAIAAVLCASCIASPLLVEAKIIEHEIKKGDSFWKIANIYKVSMDKIYELNDMTAKSFLKVGATLKVEVADDYVVAGETPVTPDPPPVTPPPVDPVPPPVIEPPVVDPVPPPVNPVTPPEPTTPKPIIASPVGKSLLLQNKAYIPPNGARLIGMAELQGAVSYISEATIKLTPEKKDLISIDYKSTDIREIISRIGKLTGKQVLYFGPPYKLTVSISVVSPMKALEHVLEVATGLSYIIDDDVIIVGDENQIRNTFMYADVTTTKNLKYLDAESLKELANALRLEYSGIDGSDSDYVKIKATPKNIAYILLAVEKIDSEQNFMTIDGKLKPILERQTLRYITGKQFAYLAERFGFTSGVIYDFKNSSVVYLSGTDAQVAGLMEIIKAFDTEENMEIINDSDGTVALPYKMNVKSPKQMTEELTATPFNFNLITIDDGRKSIYTVGDGAKTRFAMDVISRLDNEGYEIVILDSSSSTKALNTYRDSIAKITKVNKTSFYFSPNLGVGEELYYLYAIASEQDAAKLQEHKRS